MAVELLRGQAEKQGSGTSSLSFWTQSLAEDSAVVSISLDTLLQHTVRGVLQPAWGRRGRGRGRAHGVEKISGRKCYLS